MLSVFQFISTPLSELLQTGFGDFEAFVTSEANFTQLEPFLFYIWQALQHVI